MRAQPGEVLHFSEDPEIKRFVPHIAKTTALRDTAYVWAVDAQRSPDYWFPRQCPRAMTWVGPRTTDQDRQRILGPSGSARVHAIEYGWIEAISKVELFAYRFDAREFQPMQGDEAYPTAFVCTHEVKPLGPPERVGDLWQLHDEAGIEVRVLPQLHSFWSVVVESSLEYSGIRLRNARP